MSQATGGEQVNRKRDREYEAIHAIVLRHMSQEQFDALARDIQRLPMSAGTNASFRYVVGRMMSTPPRTQWD